VWKVRNVALPQEFDVLARDAHKLRADLLIIPYHDDLLGQIQQEERFRAGLAGLIDDHDIEGIKPGTYAFRHAIERHDPGWDSRATLFHMLAGRLTMPIRILARPPSESSDCHCPRHQLLPHMFAKAVQGKALRPSLSCRQVTDQGADAVGRPS
jgi:hypothetical protein